MAGASQPPDVPAPLWKAMVSAGQKYNVPPLVLAAIWRGESGSSYPNPYVNSSGYGGLFGTTNWNGSTQEQADYAAAIFHNALVTTDGNILAANGIYATGKPTPGLYGHAGLPTGTVPGYGGGPVGGKGGAAPGSVGTVPLPGSTGAGVTGPGSIIGGVAHSVASPFEAVGGFLGTISSGAFWIRASEVLGGGIMILLGLYLLARQVGLSGVSNAIPGPVGAAARSIPNPIQPSANPTGQRPQRVTKQYYLEEPASTRRKRLSAGAAPSNEIPF